MKELNTRANKSLVIGSKSNHGKSSISLDLGNARCDSQLHVLGNNRQHVKHKSVDLLEAIEMEKENINLNLETNVGSPCKKKPLDIFSLKAIRCA